MTDDQASDAVPGPDAPVGAGPILAAYWRRLFARVVDGLIVAVLTAVVTVGWARPGRTSGQFVIAVAAPVVYWVYDALLMQYRRGRTVGKGLLRIRVAVLADGSPPPASAAWTRAAVFALPNLVGCLGEIFTAVNVLWCTWDRPYRQCLHDKAARTVVVAVPRPAPVPPPAAPS